MTVNRSPVAIITGSDGLGSLNALTTAQRAEIWSDLSANSFAKLSVTTGPNAATLMTLYVLTQLASLSVADILLVKTSAVVAYILDNPEYLINPNFDTTINVPGRIYS